MSPQEIIQEALTRYERPLISHAKAITGDLESARDAVQETFLRLSRQNITALESRIAPWLFLVCRNCALDHRRKILRLSGEPIQQECPSPEPNPAAEAAANDEASLMRHLLSRLSPQQQELVRLKFEADLSYKEISEAMRLSVSNVGVQLHNAIRTLRQLWKQENTQVIR